MTKAERQKRYLDKLRKDPIRLAAFRKRRCENEKRRYRDNPEYRGRRIKYFCQWYAEHRNEQRRRIKARYWSNPEEFRRILREQAKAWYWANPEKSRRLRREASRRWRQGHPRRVKKLQRIQQRKYRARYPEKCREMQRLYVQANPDKAWAWRKKRESLLKGERISSDLFLAVLDRDKRICRYCGAGPLSGGDRTLDHVVPVAKEGRTTFGNLVVACMRCNSMKSDLSVEVFLRRLKSEVLNQKEVRHGTA